jgi:carbamoyltransferase
MKIILGINAYHGDSSACILADGQLIAAVEEERFTRIKHWAGLPVHAIKYCLEEAGVGLGDVAHVAINRNPKANYLKKSLYALSKRPSFRLIADRLKNAAGVINIETALCKALGFKLGAVKFRTHHVEHHLAHMASSFFVSPFDTAACVSIDGFGDFVGAMHGMGRGNKLAVSHRTFFPHSLGLYYLALTQYLGFPKYGDEYKVMGLAAYGQPNFMPEMRQVLKTSGVGKHSGPLFELGLEYFIHHSRGVAMTWDGGEPKMGPVFSAAMERLLGPKRASDEPLTQRHKDIAASMQRRYEEVFFYIINRVHQDTGSDNLALSGGCAMNSVANGKIFENTPFKEVYIQPAAGDAGGAIGAAYHVWNHVLGRPRGFVLRKPYLGPKYDDPCIGKVIEAHFAQIKDAGCTVKNILDHSQLCKETAAHIAEGKVIGWFQDRIEWGPRALGNRSILCDPRRRDIQELLNRKIKRRESFRPFAPSLHESAVGEYFETSYPDPFMLKVYKIRPEKRDQIPAVTHVDGTGRLQSVSREDNPLYWQLIDEFRKLTGVPVLLNTSFNENEPIVCRPEEALDCFLRTKMDVLVMGSHMISRS